MSKPVLAIMAAGMGSRYGGLKQMDPVGPGGEVIIDYSLYDAKKAGFDKAVFIIKRAIEKDFREIIGKRVEQHIDVEYAFQELDQLPAGFEVPQGREKPWGTAHALLAAKHVINGPFAAINADDYYGPQAFKEIYNFLAAPQKADGRQHYAMVGYRIENTVTSHGTVARGVCVEDSEGYLTGIAERLKIEKTASGARFTEDDGQSWTDIAAGTPVSMNFWGFGKDFLQLAQDNFAEFLQQGLKENPMKCEYLLPNYVNQLMQASVADVKVLQSGDVWHGVTYKEDKPAVVQALAQKHKDGEYPTPLW